MDTILTFTALQKAYEANGYTFFEGDLNMNLFGVRSKNRQANYFDDVLGYAYIGDQGPVMETFLATTDPGLLELTDPSFRASQEGGTAIMVPGQYRSAYRLGYHGRGAWRHRALVQVLPVAIYRDRDRDGELDMDPSRVTRGLYGINIHASSLKRDQSVVGRWSAGCQVFKRPTDHLDFISTVEAAALKYGDRFTYTLFDESDLA